MKILIIVDWYSDNMGYAENFLPKAFGKLGHEVHLISSDLQVYATSPNYDSVYKSKLGDKQTETGIFKKEYFTLHRNHNKNNRFGIFILDLEQKINEIRPDIVYCFEIITPSTVLAAKLKNKYNYHLFCESRMHSSVFVPPNTLTAKFKFWLRKRILKLKNVAIKVDKFYPLAPDVYSNITQYFGIPTDKCELASLAVETELFSPVKNTVTVKVFRNNLGFNDQDIICIYTGRFTDEKGPLVLAKAIDSLQKQDHENIKGLFVGQGSSDYQNEIERCKGCITHPFVNPTELPNIYHSSDIGVWPLQESTSQLDAMACGLPIIVNDKLEDTNRFDGNGLRFKQNDFKDLAQKILVLLDNDKRDAMGKIGSERIFSYYSWDAIARQRVKDFEQML